MMPAELMRFLHRIENLKCATRHGWTSTGRRESVAEHSYRVALMAFLLRDEFPELDMGRVLDMCLIHDWGEAVTGDIPSFLKTETDEQAESRAIGGLTATLPGLTEKLDELFSEMDARQTPEARLYKALDRIEAVIQHNEAPLDTWIPLEYELNRSYGVPDCEEFSFLSELRALALQETDEKLSNTDERCPEPVF